MMCTENRCSIFYYFRDSLKCTRIYSIKYLVDIPQRFEIQYATYYCCTSSTHENVKRPLFTTISMHTMTNK